MATRLSTTSDVELVDLLTQGGQVYLVNADGDRFAIDDDQRKRLIAALRDETMTSQQAADVLGVSRPTVVRLVDEGLLRATRPGSHRRLRTSDVVAFAEREQVRRRQAMSELGGLEYTPVADERFPSTR